MPGADLSAFHVWDHASPAPSVRGISRTRAVCVNLKHLIRMLCACSLAGVDKAVGRGLSSAGTSHSLKQECQRAKTLFKIREGNLHLRQAEDAGAGQGRFPWPCTGGYAGAPAAERWACVQLSLNDPIFFPWESPKAYLSSLGEEAPAPSSPGLKDGSGSLPGQRWASAWGSLTVQVGTQPLALSVALGGIWDLAGLWLWCSALFAGEMPRDEASSRSC